MPISSSTPPSDDCLPEAKPSDPESTINHGLSTDCIPEITHGLRAAASAPNGPDHHQLLSATLYKAISNNQIPVAKYLLTSENAPIDDLDVQVVARSASVPLLQLLVDHGFDINRRDGRGPTLLQQVCKDEGLVRWLLDHGAVVKDGGYSDPYKSPPLLESAAAMSSVDTFKLLHSRGAELGPRTLHRAVGMATIDSGELPARMGMVRFLVDELGLDVNAMDTKEQLPNHWGTPLCYAAKNAVGGEEVVAFLLDRDADPRIKDCWGVSDAFARAKTSGNVGVMEVLQNWKEKR